MVNQKLSCIAEWAYDWGGCDAGLTLSPKLVGFVSGFVGGLADTLINYPPYGLHLRLQRGETIDPRRNRQVWRLRELFRGVGAYSFIIPVTCIVDGVSVYLVERHAFSTFAATFLSGMVAAALVSAPTCNVIVMQQKYKLAVLSAVRYICGRHGLARLTTGTSLYLMREGIYGCAVFWAQPLVAAHCNALLAALLVGCVATLLSHPFDSVATTLIESELPRHCGIRDAAARMLREGGFARFYRGAVLRGYAVIAGVFVMSSASRLVKQALAPYCE